LVDKHNAIGKLHTTFVYNRQMSRYPKNKPAGKKKLPPATTRANTKTRCIKMARRLVQKSTSQNCTPDVRRLARAVDRTYLAIRGCRVQLTGVLHIAT
jgi:hypothetical protein